MSASVAAPPKATSSSSTAPTPQPTNASLPPSRPMPQRRRSRPSSLSSSSVVTIVSAARSPTSPAPSRPSTSPLATGRPRPGPTQEAVPAASRPAPGPDHHQRSLSALPFRRSNSSVGAREHSGPLNRWSQSSASSVSSSGNRKGRLSKRLSFRGSGPFGSWGRDNSQSESPPRDLAPKARSSDRSPSRDRLAHARPSVGLARPATKAEPSSLASRADPALVTRTSLSQAVDDCDSPATPAAVTPGTGELLTPATYSPAPDYFGSTWQEKAQASPPRASLSRTQTAPVGVQPKTSDPSFPDLDVRPLASSGAAAHVQPLRAQTSRTEAEWDRPAGRRGPPRDSLGRLRGGDVGGEAVQSSKRGTRERPDRVPSQKAMLSKALQKANTAVLLDNAQNFEGAMEAYGHACVLLQQVMKRSSGDEDRRKLEAIRNTYGSRISELRSMPSQDRDGGKALPARPGSGPIDMDSSLSVLSDGDEDGNANGAVINTATVTTILDDRAFVADYRESRAIEPSRVPKRRESLLPSPFDAAGPKAWGKGPRQPLQDPLVETSIQLTVPMVRDYMPPPLSPRRPMSPTAPSPERAGPRSPRKDTSDPLWADPILNRQRSRADSNESTSWLDTIDESGPSSRSSVHSRSSSLRLRRKRIRAASGATEAEFDAALDAAVEAAYDDGFEPAEDEEEDGTFNGEVVSNARRNVELAKERVREAEREAAIQMAKDRQRRRPRENAFRDRRDSVELEYREDEAEEEERMLEEMTRGFVMDESEYDLQSKSALPRQSDSSGFSGRTWGSSIGSNPTTAATSLQTLAEAPGMPSIPSKLQPKTPGALPTPSVASPTPPTPTANVPPPPPPPPPPASAPPGPPSPIGLQAPSVRNRRLSARLSGQSQEPKPLKIETAPKLPPGAGAGGPLTERRAASPSRTSDGAVLTSPPKTASAVAPTSQVTAGSLLRAQGAAVPPMPARRVPSPTPGAQSADGNVLATPGLSKTLSQESDGAIPPVPQSGSPGRWTNKGPKGTDYLRKIHSSSSLKSRNFAVSSPDESDPSPTTPQGTSFASGVRAHQKGHAPSVPALPTPTTAAFTVNGLPTGGLYLFDSDIHSPHSPGSPNPTAANAPLPLEPCPVESMLRPFWLMRCLYQTIAHPRGGYMSTRLFVPTDVWRVKGVKLKGVEEKVSCCDLLTAALLKLGKVDTCDADALLEEMQSLEAVLDQVQTALTKKLGNDVGVQGSSAMLKDAPAGGEPGPPADAAPSKSSAGSSKSSYLSWKRLRSKNSGAGLTNAFVGTSGGSKEAPAKDGSTMSSLPMTSLPMVRHAKRDVEQVRFTGPNSVYMSALARLFDAAQALDQIARQVEDPGLRHSSPTHVGLELSTRQASEFFGFYVCRFALTDMSMMLDKFIKRGSEWVLM
ncbi:MAG: hypothetical protein M1832_004431 [Thelocarpon impressellum]|nr:MAG: hypothetical protein M1832_004431 [Thelocarpon impressellum]